MARNPKPASTQKFLPISSIEQDVVILKSGGIRVVMRAHPINFDLKSETEQNAIVYGYQSFLNSLQFPIQIVVRSRRLDLERYLVKLQSQTKDITNNLLRIQAQDYIDFTRRLIQIANIMSKEFYCIVGYERVITSRNPITNLIGGKKTTGAKLSEQELVTFRQEVFDRAATVAAGLNHIGVKSELLNTQQLIELFYQIYNPEESMTEKLAPADELEASVVTAGQKDKEEQNPPSPETQELTPNN